MNKAEERACQYTGYCRNKSYSDFLNGYHQAEKDLELTWEDMLIIHKCIKDATNYHLSAFQTVEGQQKIYEDVLKRFKAMRDEKG